MSPLSSTVIGRPFLCVEERADEALIALDVPLVICANDPPWRSFWQSMSTRMDAAVTVVDAWNMDLDHLTQRSASLSERDIVGATTVVGFGGGTALDTAKFIAWKFSEQNKHPSIASLIVSAFPRNSFHLNELEK